jgi:hypothetical protein
MDWRRNVPKSNAETLACIPVQRTGFGLRGCWQDAGGLFQNDQRGGGFLTAFELILSAQQICYLFLRRTFLLGLSNGLRQRIANLLHTMTSSAFSCFESY